MSAAHDPLNARIDVQLNQKIGKKIKRGSKRRLLKMKTRTY